MSVHFVNLRKLSMDKFITLLPTHFDSEILQTIGLFRYNKKGNPESVKSADGTEVIYQDKHSGEEENERHNPDNQPDTTSDISEFSDQTKRNPQIRKKDKYFSKYAPT
jgi:lipopolysaccharide export LptBFGC system permease protein LptF